MTDAIRESVNRFAQDIVALIQADLIEKLGEALPALPPFRDAPRLPPVKSRVKFDMAIKPNGDAITKVKHNVPTGAENRALPPRLPPRRKLKKLNLTVRKPLPDDLLPDLTPAEASTLKSLQAMGPTTSVGLARWAGRGETTVRDQLHRLVLKRRVARHEVGHRVIYKVI